MPGALAGMNVLDVSRQMAGAWCARLLADFGASVTYLAPHALERAGPFAHGRSIPARYALANKTARPGTLSDIVGDLARWDVVIDDFTLASAERAALPLHSIDSHAGLVHCVVTAHGLHSASDLSNEPGNELTAFARSGWASLNGLKGRAPLRGPGFQAAYQTGTVAAVAVVGALIERLKSGRGQRIDIGVTDVLAFTLAPALLRAAYTNTNLEQRAEVDFTTGPVPCKDGYFALTPSRPHFWIEAMRVLGLPDLADHPEMQQPFSRAKHRAAYVPRVHAALLRHDRMSLFKALGARRVIAGPVLTMADLGANEHLEARKYFVDHDGTRFPGAPFRMSSTPFALRPVGRAQALEPVCVAATIADGADGLSVAHADRSPTGAATRAGPLSGYVGVVLTQAWAGTLATEILGLLGADIIQVEPFTRMDSWRGPYESPMSPGMKEVPTARHAWNCNPLFNSVNLNKRSVTLDLSKPQGVELFRQLVGHADFVAENFAPRVLGNLGLGYDALRAVKDDIILLSCSGYGATGPWSPVPAIGGTIEPSSGLSSLLGYPGEGPQNSGQMYPDAVAGLYGAYALALALLHRDRTGAGQFIDLSMQEANCTFAGEFWLQYALTGEVAGPQGNRHPDYAPHGIYPVQSDPADPRWIAIAAPDDAAFAHLCAVAGLPQGLARWPDAAARKADEAALDRQLAAWTATVTMDDLLRLLAGAGLLVAAVARPRDVLANDDLLARGIIGPVDHPEAGRHLHALVPCQMSRTPLAVTRHAPLHGEHSRGVLRNVLGLSDIDIAALVAAGVTTLGPLEPDQIKQVAND